MSDRFEALGLIVPLTADHDLDAFHSGEVLLDDWLTQRALKNTYLNASKTYVLCAPDSAKVIGFYAVCMGQTFNHEVPGSMRRNMPTQIPAVVLGRLAVDLDWQGHGLGAALLKNALRRSLNAAKDIAARLLIVHAISSVAANFYLRNGFTALSTEPLTFAFDLLKVDPKELGEPKFQ